MKKLFLGAALFVCCTAFAALQFSIVNYNTSDPMDKEHFIKLVVTEEGSLWFHNDITEWHPADLATIIDMNPAKYGAILEDGTVIYGNGDSKIFSYDVTKDGKSGIITTPGYFVGNFKEGDVLHLWITSLQGEYGNTLDEILADPNTELTARYNPEFDWVNKNIQDYKFASGNPDGAYNVGDWMFVMASDDWYEKKSPSGAPLPGVMTSIAVIGIGVAALKKLKRKN